MNQELLQIILMITVSLIFLLGIFLLVYLSDKKAKELEKRGLK